MLLIVHRLYSCLDKNLFSRRERQERQHLPRIHPRLGVELFDWSCVDNPLQDPDVLSHLDFRNMSGFIHSRELVFPRVACSALKFTKFLT